MNLQKADGALHPAELGTEYMHSLQRERLREKPKPVRDASSAAQQHAVLFPRRGSACLPTLSCQRAPGSQQYLCRLVLLPLIPWLKWCDG